MDAGETASRTISISNAGDGTLEWSVSYDKPWITVNPTSGTNSGTITLDINTAGMSQGSYTGTITVISNGGTKTGSVNLNIVQPTVTKGLVAYYSFDEGEGDGLRDYSGNGNDGTIYGAKWVDGKYGNALYFDGDGDYVRINDDSSLYPFYGFTIAAWVKPAADTSGWGNVRVVERAWHNPVLLVRNGKYATGINADGNWYTCFAHGGGATANEWKNVAGTWDGQVLKLYVNGVLVDTDDSGCNQIQYTYGVIDIGQATKGGYAFSGTIDEVRIYNRALIADEIKTLYEGKQAA